MTITNWAHGRLPSGPYLFDVVNTVAVTTHNGHKGRELWLKLRRTDLHLHYRVYNTPKARWSWVDIINDFEELEGLVGRSFIAIVAREKRPTDLPSRRPAELAAQRPEYINRVVQIIAEVES
jgi:hypothetical protein